MVQTLAADELQRDLQRELTYDGLRAAEAKGNKGGRRPVLAGDTAADVRAAYLEGQSTAALGDCAVRGQAPGRARGEAGRRTRRGVRTGAAGSGLARRYGTSPPLTRRVRAAGSSVVPWPDGQPTAEQA
ncbi:hypothetical protein [Streptomyces sp. NPDC017529]|uniref:hypothetical protein n=1 Tax=Streptomyces sp. NPDC017529 TaxID=3365000 RepID=UPI0037998264